MTPVPPLARARLAARSRLLLGVFAALWLASATRAQPADFARALSHEAIHHDDPAVSRAIATLAEAGFLTRVHDLAVADAGAGDGDGDGDRDTKACRGSVLRRVSCAIEAQRRRDPRYFLGSSIGLEVDAQLPYRITEVEWDSVIEPEFVRVELMFEARIPGEEPRSCFSDLRVRPDGGGIDRVKLSCAR